MPTMLFELGEHTATGPAYDMEAAAGFYLPMRDKAVLLGLGDLATRLTRMVEIDAEALEQAKQHGLSPIFLSPDAYPIEGEAPEALLYAGRIRRLITHPSLKDIKFGPVLNVEGSEQDLKVTAQVEAIENLLVHPNYQPMGYLEPDYHTYHWYMPTVIDGIAIQKEEVIHYDANKGAKTFIDGRWTPLPRITTRKIGLTVYRASSTPTR